MQEKHMKKHLNKQKKITFLIQQTARKGDRFLRFEKYIGSYYKRLFYTQKKHEVQILFYLIIDDTVYLMVSSRELKTVLGFIANLHGVVAADHSKATGKTGPFWKELARYTLVDNGTSFRMVLLKMILLPVQKEYSLKPEGWKHSSYKEMLVPKERYRLLSQSGIVHAAGFKNYDDFLQWMMESVEGKTSNILDLDINGLLAILNSDFKEFLAESIALKGITVERVRVLPKNNI